MQRIRGSADEVRALAPSALESWRYIRENVLERGIVDQRIKELCFRYLANDVGITDLDRFEGRERAALEWTDAIAYDSDRATTAIWERLLRRLAERTTKQASLGRLNDPEPIVDEDDRYDGRTEPLRGLELLDVHEEAAVSRERDDFSVRKEQLRGDRSW